MGNVAMTSEPRKEQQAWKVAEDPPSGQEWGKKSFQQMVLEQLDSHMQKKQINLDTGLTPFAKN